MSLAHDYARVFRIWPVRADKTPMAAGFDHTRPTATYHPSALDPALPVGVLCGPLAAGLEDCGFHILGLDLDKAMDRTALEALLGPLPETLTSKNWHHAYYWIPNDHPLHQRNAALVCEGGQLDIRPCAGGFLAEKGDWDRGFDPDLIAEFPAEALSRLHAAIGEKRKRDGVPAQSAPVQIADRDVEVTTLLASMWKRATTGDLAFGGLGGWLARRGVSLDRAQAIAGELAELTESTHPDPVARVEQAYDGACPLGRPSVQAALSRDVDEVEVLATLEAVERLLSDSVGGFEQPAAAPTEWHEMPVSSPDVGTEFKLGDTGRKVFALMDAGEMDRGDEPLPWVIEDLVSVGEPTLIVGGAGSGKTSAMVDLALCVATGREVWGRFKVAKPGPVVHIDYEQGKTLRRTYHAFAAGLGLRASDLVREGLLRIAPLPREQLLDQNVTDKFMSTVGSALVDLCRGASLCIVNSLTAGTNKVNENDAKIAAVFNLFSRVTEITGCAFIVLHHSGKTAGGSRGSSAIDGAVQTIYQIGYQKGQSFTTWEHKKDRPASGTIDPFKLVWSGPGAVQTLKVEEPLRGPEGERREDRIERAILFVMANKGLGVRDRIIECVRGRKTDKIAVFEDLKVRGLIEHLTGTKYVLAAGVLGPKNQPEDVRSEDE